MKALILTTDNGVSYDGFEWWVTGVLLVPDDWDRDADWTTFCEGLKTHIDRRHWFRKDGQLSDRYINQAFAAWEASLTMRFESIPFIGGTAP